MRDQPFPVPHLPLPITRPLGLSSIINHLFYSMVLSLLLLASTNNHSLPSAFTLNISTCNEIPSPFATLHHSLFPPFPSLFFPSLPSTCAPLSPYQGILTLVWYQSLLLPLLLLTAALSSMIELNYTHRSSSPPAHAGHLSPSALKREDNPTSQ